MNFPPSCRATGRSWSGPGGSECKESERSARSVLCDVYTAIAGMEVKWGQVHVVAWRGVGSERTDTKQIRVERRPQTSVTTRRRYTASVS